MNKLLKATNSIPVDIKTVVSILKEKWCWENYIEIKGKTLKIHTGGWSEHEYIIGKLEKTMFWNLYWYRSERGGHYWFKFDRNIKCL